ncbi:MAG: alpha-hydroxy acid oxidase [Eubacteriales bacterium]|nr:alpha-hydroxy acid oxidase [Eubacteriales bacterium]
MAANNGNSNEITREYLDSLLIETRYMNSTNPDLTLHLFGKTFGSPVMTASLSFLDHFLFEGATKCYAEGAAKAGAILWIGMAGNDDIEMCVNTGAPLVEIIKPFADRDLIYSKIRHAEACGVLAVGIDIDHPFAEDGSPDIVDGYKMAALTTAELKSICSSTSLPVIAKGVLSTYDARQVLRAGVSGLVVSHHNSRIAYALPPLAILPEIKKITGDSISLFVDGDIRTGFDAFKALALGASAVCIGRPIMAAIRQNGSDGMAEYLKKVNGELAKAMAFTGCTDLGKMDPTVIHRL